MSGAGRIDRRGALVVGAAGLVAASVGAGFALLRARREVAGEEMQAGDLWTLSFERLDGSTLPMGELRGQPLLLNFWATWCGPCVVEMPLLNQFAHEQAGSGWGVLALAIDQADPVRHFLAARNLQLPVALGGAGGIDLSRALGNGHGALPFSAVFDSGGAFVERNVGAVSADLLHSWRSQIR